MHVQLADEAICIGKPAANESYLRIDRIISAAEIADVDAIHPGYGFPFRERAFCGCLRKLQYPVHWTEFTGDERLEDKAISRTLAKKAGVPTPPGSEGLSKTSKQHSPLPKRIGYPVMIKAVAGGGGRGMRAAHNDVSLVKVTIPRGRRQRRRLGTPGFTSKKFIENPHHIEFQIMGDGRGNIIHLGERDCSVQRRNQKSRRRNALPAHREQVSQTPQGNGQGGHPHCATSPLPPTLVRSSSSWTDKGNFYFLEVNKRIQVEHPITEEVTGVDLVRLQILIAAVNR